MLPIDTSVEAEYTDGFILSESELQDISPYNATHNVLRAIINDDPVAEHGKLVRFSVFYKNQRHDVDWTGLPDDARPIRFRHGYSNRDDYGNIESGWSGVDFGYQYNKDGNNVQEVVKL